MGFINIRAFKHAINVTRGKYSDPADAGEVSHFQALATALSATVGLGNIAGVAIAVGDRRPGRDLLDDHRRPDRHEREVHRVHARPEVP